ncbi:MAG: hypothetical protein SOR77_08810 [Peptoniphilus sp.]|uniref:hypothetical protein n=1 Tax=Peptoniphilus sp. TaxID=1971214 RepID=UPI002A75E0CC|nr:hypothetical protein [Peptoniphilus sp.]MDY2987718.1 hypothetical protein [Peptoniphilus sp.]
MNIDRITAIAIEKGSTTVLSLLMIYAVWQVIRHAPGFGARLIDAFTLNTSAIDKSTLYLAESRNIHENMDKKIDTIQDSVEDLKATILQENQNNKIEIIQKINKLEEEIKNLKGGKYVQ